MSGGPALAAEAPMTLHDRVAAARVRLAAAGLTADTAAFDAEVLDGRLDDLIEPLLAHYREESLHADEKP